MNKKFTDRQMQNVINAYHYGYSYTDIADAFGLKPSQVVYILWQRKSNLERYYRNSTISRENKEK